MGTAGDRGGHQGDGQREALGQHKCRVVSSVPWVDEGVETFETSLERKVQSTENRGNSIPWGKGYREQKHGDGKKLAHSGNCRSFNVSKT